MDSTSITGLAAVAQTVRHATSARPDAPVAPHHRRPRPKPPTFTIVPARIAAASGLRWLADAVAPRQRLTCTPHATAR